MTLDDGVTWHTAELQQDDSPLNRCWSWSIWEVVCFYLVKLGFLLLSPDKFQIRIFL